MNTVFLVSPHNAAELVESAEMFAEKQSTSVNGALVVIHTSGAADEARKIANTLAPKFRAANLIKVVGNESGLNISISTLFARFLLSCYTKFPGPWMVIDGWTKPLVDNVFDVAMSQHRVSGAKVSGMAQTTETFTRPSGPFVMELDMKPLKFLRFPSTEPWRHRIGHVLRRMKFGHIKREEWPFTLSKSPEAEREVKIIDPNEPVDYESLDDNQLREIIRQRTGTKPHHFTKRENLLAQLTS